MTKLTAVCTFCHHDAPFTRRITTETEVEVIGGSDKYVATCRTCFSLPMDGILTPKLEKHLEALNKLSDLKVITQLSPVKLSVSACVCFLWRWFVRCTHMLCRRIDVKRNTNG